MRLPAASRAWRLTLRALAVSVKVSMSISRSPAVAVESVAAPSMTTRPLAAVALAGVMVMMESLPKTARLAALSWMLKLPVVSMLKVRPAASLISIVRLVLVSEAAYTWSKSGAATPVQLPEEKQKSPLAVSGILKIRSMVAGEVRVMKDWKPSPAVPSNSKRLLKPPPMWTAVSMAVPPEKSAKFKP